MPALTSYRPLNKDLYLFKGSSFLTTFIVKDTAGAAVNITGMEPSVTVKRYVGTETTYPMEVAITSPATGVITLSVDASSAEDYVHPKYVYEVKLADNTDTITVMYGFILTTQAV